MLFCPNFPVPFRPLSVMWDTELDCTESEAVARRKAGEGKKEAEM